MSDGVIVTDRTVELEHEIAEHERTGAKLRESEERFKDFAEAASDWFWEQDADLGGKLRSRWVLLLGTLPEADPRCSSVAQRAIASESPLGQNRKSITTTGMSDVGGRADLDRNVPNFSY